MSIECRKCGQVVKNLTGLAVHDRKHRRASASYSLRDSDRQAAREICRTCSLRYDEHDGREYHRFEAI